MELIGLLFLAYFSIGTFYTRKSYARHIYMVAQKTSCDGDCPSRDWTMTRYRNRYCRCGYRRESKTHLMTPFFGWPVVLFANFLKGGTYTPDNNKDLQIEALQRQIEKAERELGIGRL